jgi:hypothetical protein
MTPKEENDLRALGNELAEALQSPREPSCVARAFATPAPGTIALTMQGWIDLEAIHSPLLRLELPEPPDALEAAARIFALTIRGLTPKEALLVARAMRRATAEAFATALPMRRPGDTDGGGDDGFGAWLPLFAFLILECGLDPASAHASRVDQAFALLAACRRNQGWACVEASYAQRDVIEANATTPGPVSAAESMNSEESDV